MRYLLVIWVWVSVAGYARGNAAAPHYRFPGGHTALVYAQDSTLVRQVHLRQERILVQVYRDYAVVYGRYVFAKTDARPAAFTLGYPVFNELKPNYRQGAPMYDEYPDEPLHLRAWVNGRRVDTGYVEVPQPEPHLRAQGYVRYWYTWPAHFTSDSLVCEVFFMVRTADAHFRHGYASEHGGGFCYILSSGAVWQRPITRGEILIKLMDGLTLEDVRGLHPARFHYSVDKQWFRWQFADKVPQWDDNILLRYHSASNNQPVPDIDSLYARIKGSEAHIPGAGWRPLPTSKSEIRAVHAPVKQQAVIYVIDLLFLAGIYAPLWLPLLIGLIIALWWYRRRKRRARTGNTGR
ncbi:MAG: hypothetical protein KF690_11785 [Bacteroidetes bacterium]|nr:hypothetical protein [Bacteroidota bacterium]